MRNEDRLRGKAREAMQAGKIPYSSESSLWGGRGGGGTDCAVCDQPVTPDELEYELEFASTTDDFKVRSYLLHVGCFAAWHWERRNFIPDDASYPCQDESTGQSPVGPGCQAPRGDLPEPSSEQTMVGSECSTDRPEPAGFCEQEDARRSPLRR